jgi:hypothetical protein
MGKQKMPSRLNVTLAKTNAQTAALCESVGDRPTRYSSRAAEMRAARAAILADRSSAECAVDGAMLRLVGKLSSPAPEVLARKIRNREVDLARLAMRLSIPAFAETLAA